MRSRRIRINSLRKRHDNPEYLKKLLAVGAQATELGIAVFDSQLRFQSVNASLARQTRAAADDHIGKTSHEIVGDLARQIEPTYERVLSRGESATVAIEGSVRDNPEFGYWMDHCFPIFDSSGQVQQVGLFVVNVTVEKASIELFNSLTDPKRQLADAAGLLDQFQESIRQYHLDLKLTMEDLASPLVEAARKAERFRSSVERLDREVGEMRELIYAVMSHFSISAC